MSPCHLTAIRNSTEPWEVGVQNSTTQTSGTQTSKPQLWLAICTLHSPNPKTTETETSYFKTGSTKTKPTQRPCPEPTPDPGSLPLKGSKHLVPVWPWWRKDLSSMVWQDGIKSSIKFIYTIVIALHVYIIFHLKYILVLLLHRILLLQPMFV